MNGVATGPQLTEVLEFRNQFIRADKFEYLQYITTPDEFEELESFWAKGMTEKQYEYWKARFEDMRRAGQMPVTQ